MPVYYHSENHATSQIWKILPNMVFPPIWGGKNGGVLSMRMQVILDSSFARLGSAPIWGGKKGEFRDRTKTTIVGLPFKDDRHATHNKPKTSHDITRYASIL